MKKSSKRVIARVMAILMALSVLPFDMWTTANVVMAEGLSDEADESSEIVEETTTVEDETSNPDSEEVESELEEDIQTPVEEDPDEEPPGESDEPAAEPESDTTEPDEDEGFVGEADAPDNTEYPGYTLTNTKTWTFDSDFWNAHKVSDANFDGIIAESSSGVSAKTSNPISLSLKAGKISLPVQQGTQAVEIVFVAANSGAKKILSIGTGSVKDIPLSQANDSEYTSGLLLGGSNGYFSGVKLYLEEKASEEVKISKLTLNEYQSTEGLPTKLQNPKIAPESGSSLEVNDGTISITYPDPDESDVEIYYNINETEDPDKDDDDATGTKLYSGELSVSSILAELEESGESDVDELEIKAYAVKDSTDDEEYEASDVETATYYLYDKTKKLSMPDISIDPDENGDGEIEKGTTVTITVSEDDTENIAIYYTTDKDIDLEDIQDWKDLNNDKIKKYPESEDVEEGEYKVTFNITDEMINVADNTVKIQAVAVDESDDNPKEASQVNTKTYTVQALASITADRLPKDGTVKRTAKITLSLSNTTVEGAQIYYTTDGKTPTVSDANLYTEPIEIKDNNTNIKAIASHTQYANSPLFSETYMITGSKSNSGGAIHNFTVSETQSSYFTISASKVEDAVSPKEYGELSLTGYIELDDATVKFTPTDDGTLTLVTDSTGSAVNVTASGSSATAYTSDANGIVTVPLTKNTEYTISKSQDTVNLYYIVVKYARVGNQTYIAETTEAIEAGAANGVDLYFTLSDNLVADANNKNILLDGDSVRKTHRFKLSDKDKDKITFTVSEGSTATIDVFAVSSNSGTDGEIALYKKGADGENSVVKTIAAKKSNDYSGNATVPAVTVEDLEGGETYYLARTEGAAQGAGVFYIRVKETKTGGSEGTDPDDDYIPSDINGNVFIHNFTTNGDLTNYEYFEGIDGEEILTADTELSYGDLTLTKYLSLVDDVEPRFTVPRYKTGKLTLVFADADKGKKVHIYAELDGDDIIDTDIAINAETGIATVDNLKSGAFYCISNSAGNGAAISLYYLAIEYEDYVEAGQTHMPELAAGMPQSGEVTRGTYIKLQPNASDSADTKIYYTLDGTEPNSDEGETMDYDDVKNTGILIKDCTPIIAIAIDGNNKPSYPLELYYAPPESTNPKHNVTINGNSAFFYTFPGYVVSYDEAETDAITYNDGTTDLKLTGYLKLIDVGGNASAPVSFTPDKNGTLTLVVNEGAELSVKAGAEDADVTINGNVATVELVARTWYRISVGAGVDEVRLYYMDIEYDVTVDDSKATIWVVGDSTLSGFNDPYYIPREGYGEQIETYFDATVHNLAKSGASSKDFCAVKVDKDTGETVTDDDGNPVYDMSEYNTLIYGSDTTPKLGDADTKDKFLIIGFGHNDEKLEAGRYTNPNGDYHTPGSFANSLYENYIKLAIERGVTPVVATPIVRLIEGDNVTAEGYRNSSQGHITTGSSDYPGGNYPKAIRDMVDDLKEDGIDVILIDMTEATIAKNVDQGVDSQWRHAFTGAEWASEEEKDKPDNTGKKNPTGLDPTHTNHYGAKMNAYLFNVESKKEDTLLSKYAKASVVEPSKDADYEDSINKAYVPAEVTPPTDEEGANSGFPVYTDASGRKWYGTAFGDVGGDSHASPDDFPTTINADNSITVEAKKGKIASKADGFVFYYTSVPAGTPFTLTAKAEVVSFVSNNQVSYGLMARDEVLINKYEPNTMGDYVAAATRNTTTDDAINCYGRKYGDLNDGPTATYKYNTPGDTLDLMIIGTTDGYSMKYGENELVTTGTKGGFDYPLTGIVPDKIYVGFFVAREAKITFSDISLEIEMAPPTINIAPAPVDGVIEDNAQISITTTEDATIHYATDGNPATADSAVYGEALTASAIADEDGKVSISAIVVNADGKASAATPVQTYTLKSKADEGGGNVGGGDGVTVNAPVITINPVPSNGEIRENATITITADDDDAIHYTTDGTLATADSTLVYSAPFTAGSIANNNTVSISAIAVRVVDGVTYTSDATPVETYTVKSGGEVITVNKPSISISPTPSNGEISETAKITITVTGDADAKIRYATDGKAATITSNEYPAGGLTAKDIAVNNKVSISAIAYKVVDGDTFVSDPTEVQTYTVKSTGTGGGGTESGDVLEIRGLEDEYPFTGAKIIPDIYVVDTSIIDPSTDEPVVLAEKVDYTVKYSNNTKADSTASITVTGKGNYAGKAIARTFKIVEVKQHEENLADLKGAKIKKIAPVDYNGEKQYPDFELTLKGASSSITYKYDGDGYETDAEDAQNVNIAVSNNINKGTATILVTGSGTTKVKATFKINAVNIDNAVLSDTVKPSGVYAVKGAVPDEDTVELTINLGTTESPKYYTLKKGVDYTVKYSNNKKVGTAKMVFTGKGNFAKKKNSTFEVTPLDMSDLKIAVAAYEGVKTNKVKATVLDTQGNPLKANQYTLSVYDEDGTTQYSQAKLAKGDNIVVVATAKDTTNLESESQVATEVFTVGANIGKAKFKLKKVNGKTLTKIYTGSEIELSKDDLEVTMKGVTGEITYDIVGYTNNIKKGTATAYIQGTGEYGGTAKVKFKIVAKTVNFTTDND